MYLSDIAVLLADAGLAAGIPIGMPLGIPIGMAIGTGAAQKKLKSKLENAIASGEIQVADRSGKPMSPEAVLELLGCRSC